MKCSKVCIEDVNNAVRESDLALVYVEWHDLLLDTPKLQSTVCKCT